MNTIYTNLLLTIIISISFSSFSKGQPIDTIYGCDDIPAVGVLSDCLVCEFDIIYGSTDTYTASRDAGYCGTVENDQYIGFITSSIAEELIFEIETFDCSNKDGFQAAVYNSSNQLVGDCTNLISPESTILFKSEALIPRTIYYLRIDGFAGDICNFSIKAISGVATGNLELFNPEISGNQTLIEFSPSPCTGSIPEQDSVVNFDGCEYDAAYSMTPSNLAFQVQTTGRTDSFQLITWPARTAQRVVLTQNLQLVDNNSTGACPASLSLPYYSHFLDLTDNTPIDTKMWNCSSDRLVGTISDVRMNSELHLLASGLQTYVLSGAGYHGFGYEINETLFDYIVIQNSDTLYSGSLTENNFQRNLFINHNLGPAFIQFYNPFPWSMEVAIERLDAAQPWTITDISNLDLSSKCVSTIVSATGSISPNYTNIQNINFNFEIVSTELINTNGTSYQSPAVLTSNIDNSEITIDSIAIEGQLPPGDYLFEARIRSVDDQTPMCGTNNVFSFLHDFSISEPADSVIFKDIYLNSDRDSVILFRELELAHQIITNTTGTYYSYIDCIVYEHTLHPPLVIIDLGIDTLCPGQCLYAPTGQMISCGNRTYSFLASNDTTYTGTLFIERLDPLSIVDITYECEGDNGEWYLDLSWTGSKGPYFLDGQEVNETFQRLGPFQGGQNVDISLHGSSVCGDTLRISESYTCVSSTSSTQGLGFEFRQLSNSLLQVESPSFGWNLRLVDVLGREVYATPLQQGTNQLSVIDLQAGSYFIVVENGKTLATKKWVKR